MTVNFINFGCAHPSWDCSKPTKSTASWKDVRRVEVSGVNEGDKVALAGSVASTQALPVDTIPNIGLMQSVSKDTLKVVPSLTMGDKKRDEAGATPALPQVATDTLPKPKMVEIND